MSDFIAKRNLGPVDLKCSRLHLNMAPVGFRLFVSPRPLNTVVNDDPSEKPSQPISVHPEEISCVAGGSCFVHPLQVVNLLPRNMELLQDPILCFFQFGLRDEDLNVETFIGGPEVETDVLPGLGGDPVMDANQNTFGFQLSQGEALAWHERLAQLLDFDLRLLHAHHVDGLLARRWLLLAIPLLDSPYPEECYLLRPLTRSECDQTRAVTILSSADNPLHSVHLLLQDLFVVLPCLKDGVVPGLRLFQVPRVLEAILHHSINVGHELFAGRCDLVLQEADHVLPILEVHHCTPHTTGSVAIFDILHHRLLNFDEAVPELHQAAAINLVLQVWIFLRAASEDLQDLLQCFVHKDRLAVLVRELRPFLLLRYAEQSDQGVVFLLSLSFRGEAARHGRLGLVAESGLVARPSHVL
mmetsp:Transcript_107319/g.256275  ORF Transcript_107319/g.256275 Transcript_107319/m.256275 type:complete len:413 (-) Transcript_107319:4826-6064(-)